ncbi:hypothetical protein PT300_05705 [Enterobacteriaceae bacterium ESL0689]|nr:hypothetical protein [Enterobacteriaceae bacterium ESL0689]
MDDITEYWTTVVNYAEYYSQFFTTQDPIEKALIGGELIQVCNVAAAVIIFLGVYYEKPFVDILFRTFPVLILIVYIYLTKNP